jgi:hypothetical protein
MNLEPALTITIFAILSLFLFFYCKFDFIPSQKKFVKSTVNEIIDQILHFNPKIPESEWEEIMSRNFKAIFENLSAVHEEVALELFENRSLPMAIAFFALYRKVVVKPFYSHSRAKINKFVTGAKGLTAFEQFSIVCSAFYGVKEWNKRLIIRGKDVSSFEKFTERLQNLMKTDIPISLSPYFSTC